MKILRPPSPRVLIRLCALGAALGALIAIAGSLPFFVPEASAHGDRNAILNSCESLPPRITEGRLVTLGARVTNRDAGISAAALYVVFHVYHDGREVYKYKTPTKRVSRGSSTTFLSRGIEAGSSRLPVGRSEIVCGLWRENTIGGDTLQEHTGGGESGHPISNASITVSLEPPTPEPPEEEESDPDINRTSPRPSVTLEEGDSQEFTARASDDDGDLTAVEWRLDGDRVCRESIGSRREYTSSCEVDFDSEGTYRLVVTFTDRRGATDSDRWDITVDPQNRPPVINSASPSGSVTLEVGDSQEFTASASDPDGNMNEVEWMLDGRFQCGESARSGSSHTSDCELRFSSEGRYRLEVTFKDAEDADDMATWNITVERGNSPPVINSASPSHPQSLRVCLINERWERGRLARNACADRLLSNKPVVSL